MADLQSRIAKMTQDLLKLGSGDDRVRSAVVAVEWKDHGSAAAAAGIARADGAAPMRVGTQFHIASVGKPMTAALIFQAVEEGKLGAEGIDARLIDTDALPRDICRRLHKIDGVGYGDHITIHHLLTHASGLRDAQIDDCDVISEGYGGKPAPKSIVGRRAGDMRLHLDAITKGQIPAALLRTQNAGFLGTRSGRTKPMPGS